jgi:hypothetical protein
MPLPGVACFLGLQLVEVPDEFVDGTVEFL